MNELLIMCFANVFRPSSVTLSNIVTRLYRNFHHTWPVRKHKNVNKIMLKRVDKFIVKSDALSINCKMMRLNP